ncbi:MAG: MOSC domain-containing protein [Jatrophihabitans sp.]|uniref:MOSC domain-containing protein n=1 Tax=Jatrophihabitans sp. TaxID=1932789 RepID=UPI003F7F69C1
MGTVVTVNVGRPAPLASTGRPVLSAIVKTPVEGRVGVRGVNLDGDDQADRSVHGGPDKAVYAYASEDTARWQAELGRDLGAAPFGENLTTAGIDLSAAVIGERWRVGTAVFEVSQPRTPCFKLAARLGEPGFVKTFARAARPGAYLRIVTEGDVGAGDEIRLEHRPGHGVTVHTVFRAILLDPSLADEALRAPELAAQVRDWLAGRG